MLKDLDAAADSIRTSQHCHAFTGAGISVESGIPPFRGPDGLWSRYDPHVLDLDYFHSNPLESWTVIKEIFYDFFQSAQPNRAHEVLALWEARGLCHSVITQNIDNLHQQAGSRTVHEFHGNSQRLVCTRCHASLPARDMDLSTLPPRCHECGGLLKPDFIFFGEMIPEAAHTASMAAAHEADVFLVIGSTGEVMPASWIPDQAKQSGATVIEVNPQPSRFTDTITDIYLPGKAAAVLDALESRLTAD